MDQAATHLKLQVSQRTQISIAVSLLVGDSMTRLVSLAQAEHKIMSNLVNRARGVKVCTPPVTNHPMALVVETHVKPSTPNSLWVATSAENLPCQNARWVS